jgi:hypothetical protein
MVNARNSHLSSKMNEALASIPRDGEDLPPLVYDPHWTRPVKTDDGGFWNGQHWIGFAFLLPFVVMLAVHEVLDMSDALLAGNDPRDDDARLYNLLMVVAVLASRWMARRSGRRSQSEQTLLSFLRGVIIGLGLFSICVQLPLALFPGSWILEDVQRVGLVSSPLVGGLASATLTARRLRKMDSRVSDGVRL